MNRNRKNVVRLTESKLRNMIKESIKSILKESEGNLEKEFSQWVRMVSTNPQEYGLNYNPMALLRDCYYGIEGNEESYSETDNMIYDMAEDFANYKGMDNNSMIRNAVKNVAYSNQLLESKKNVVRLTESQLKQIVAESVKKALKEIGDTPKGRYALAAVQGRAHARMRNARQAGNNAEYEKQRQLFYDTDDTIQKGQQQGYANSNKSTYGGDMAQADDKGYRYGYRKGQAN